MTSKPPAFLVLSAYCYAVREIAPGPQQSILLTLDRPLVLPKGRRESVLVLEQGPNKEPVRLLEPPAGATLRVRAVY